MTALPTAHTLTEPRNLIRRYTHADEAVCIERLLSESTLTEAQRERIVARGRALVNGCRGGANKAGMLDVFLQQFSLSSKEGVALMCLAESLLRVPDAETADDLIAEKILSGNWSAHRGQSESLFVNASTWGLMLTGRVVRLDNDIVKHTDNWLKKLVNRLSEPVVRAAVSQAMKIMGQQYVLGRSIDEAIKRGTAENVPGTRFSFDMLGEGARTMKDADRYFQAYSDAIHAIGKRETHHTVYDANGISVKFSALHPRYQYAQRERVMSEMLPRIRDLAKTAKQYNLGFSIDAEEADRLDISLDIFEALARDPDLVGWDGLGFVLQAYGKRAPFVAEWLADLARDSGRKFMVRLVKGAYWDSEIKHAQEEGYRDFPVYTRKVNTDLGYQVCAAKLLDAQDVLYPQFATHNAHTAALILEIGKGKTFEFQRLHGMGDLLFGELRQSEDGGHIPVRVYAPVGAHKDLLPYLVRRLLENGANSSFVNRFLDKKVPVEQVIQDVQKAVEKSSSRRHKAIPLPVDMFRAAGEERADTHGIDLANADAVEELLNTIEPMAAEIWATGPIIGGKVHADNGQPVVCPANTKKVVGGCRKADANDVNKALNLASAAQPAWDALGGAARAAILERAADMMEARMPQLVGLIAYEAGRTLNDGVSEVREAVDFLRYYALQARRRFQLPERVTGPLGDVSEHRLHGRGVFFCISPWNFPLAIFTGQVTAALAAGNSVIAKPADPTPIIAAESIKILHEAGVPGDVLHFLPGRGSVIGPILTSDPRVSGVAFTGSTETALDIQKSLVRRGGEVAAFIAETGGQNTMIVDSSSLPEQVVDDAIRSAFLSAGQRCSALRVMYIQDEIADGVIQMLKGAMAELKLGDPWRLDTDVGPVIDESAQRELLAHIDNMKKQTVLHFACKLPEGCKSGTYVPPHLFELQSITQLPGEVFGPILHVIRYKKANLDRVIDEINGTGFGLTLGVHSRIESFANDVVRRTRVGNNYINRNMVGAVVGVNPFGGQGLSGTGPKAGGPNYLTRFAEESVEVIEVVAESGIESSDNPASPITAIIGGDELTTINAEQIHRAIQQAANCQPVWDLVGGEARAAVLEKTAALIDEQLTGQRISAGICRYYAGQAREKCGRPIELPGPTGESNQLTLHGRGVFFCAMSDGAPISEFVQQIAAALAAGNAVIARLPANNTTLAAKLVKRMLVAGVAKEILHVASGDSVTEAAITDPRTAGVAWSGPVDDALAMQMALVERGGAIVPMVVEPSGPNYLSRFVVEKTKTVNIVATGGNALLLNLNEESVA